MSQKCPKCFGVRKLSKYFTSLLTFIDWSVHARCSLTDTDMQGETHISTSVTELCPWFEKCVKFVIIKGLSKNCPRKFGMADRSPNRIRTFSEVQNFWTPIYTSSRYHIGNGPFLSRDIFCPKAQLNFIVPLRENRA